MTEFKKIYLQPECCVEDQEVGRMWCQDAINDCEEGNKWIEYTLASESKQRIADLGKGYEQLRIAALNAVCKIGGGQAKADLKDAYDKATEQLEALKDQGNE
jgi:hypothetical protein